MSAVPDKKPSDRLIGRVGGVIIAVVGLLVAVAGLVVGLVPVSNCGAFFAPAGQTGFGFDSVLSDVVCQGSLAGRGWWVWSLIILGVAALLFGLVRALSHAETVVVERPTLSQVQRERQAQNQSAADMKQNIAQQIAELGALRDQGLITGAEFDAKKAELLARL